MRTSGDSWQPVRRGHNAAVALQPLRQQIVDGARPLLNRGEVVAHVVRTLRGPPRLVVIAVAIVVGTLTSPFIGLLSFVPMLAVFLGLYRKWALLATDQNLVIVDCGRAFWRPRRIVDRLPIETPIGPAKGLFLAVTVGGHKLYVVGRRPNVTEIAAADRDLAD